ncbi:MAG: SHOCT domain-containing protein [Proteobacteria bacterium]|nr:SHOCT domain-containing protein [Pseudomonadota bacterium]
MGLTYKKKYAVDRPMATAQAPESSLYFTCVNPNAANEVSTTSDSVKFSIAEEIQKLVSLKDKGVLSESEFQAAKKKLLSL